jgi:hypothetical protein
VLLHGDDLTETEERKDKCCVRNAGLCSYHAAHIAKLSQVPWWKLIGENVMTPTDEEIQRQQYEKEQAEERSRRLRNQPPPPSVRLLHATRGAFTGRNRRAA